MAAAAAVVTFDIDKLLWVPGEKTIFLPAFEGIRIPQRFLIREGQAFKEAPLGISIRFVQQYDIQADRLPVRDDWFYQAAPLSPSWPTN